MLEATGQARAASRACALLLAACAFLCAACASPIRRVGDEFRHGRHDYTIGAPDGPGAPWQRVSVEGAVLAFRRPGPETMSLLSRCGKPVAAPQLMARHLTMGLGERSLVSSGPVEIDGREGWSQVFETERNGTKVRVKTVTLVADGCSFDWILASSLEDSGAEAAFDAWWSSFRLGSRYRDGDAA